MSVFKEHTLRKERHLCVAAGTFGCRCVRGQAPCRKGSLGRFRERGDPGAFVRMEGIFPTDDLWKGVLGKEDSICREKGRWNSEPKINMHS